jgi:hypothetical protein
MVGIKGRKRAKLCLKRENKIEKSGTTQLTLIFLLPLSSASLSLSLSAFLSILDRLEMGDPGMDLRVL